MMVGGTIESMSVEDSGLYARNIEDTTGTDLEKKRPWLRKSQDNTDQIPSQNPSLWPYRSLQRSDIQKI